jgi:DNA-binding winged helix-turn-helix (wHTH) protein/tetratricopeptide (TPR) repeat protein
MDDPKSRHSLSFGPFRLDLSAGRLLLRDQPVHLTPKALGLLQLLASRPGELIGKREIFAALWTDTVVSDDALSRCISELRGARALSSSAPRFLETVYRRGFRFIAPVLRPQGEGASQLPFVGRERELEAARVWLAQRSGGRVRILGISGEPGVGKTRLAREIARLAIEAGATALWSHTPGDEGAPPFAVWRQLLDGQLARSGPNTSAVSASRGETIALQDGRQRAYETVARRLEALTSQRRLLLVLDDLHGADRDSLHVLDHLLQDTENARLAIVCTVRDVGAPENSALRQVLDSASSEACASIELRGLSRDEVGQLLALRIGDERARRVSATALERSGGNPLYLNEFAELVPGDLDAASLPAAIPETLRQLIARRLDAVSALCAEVLTVAAVAGPDVPLALLREAAQLGVEALTEGVEEAVAQRLVVWAEEAPSQIRFTHGLVREVSYERARPGLRARLHRRIAHALEQENGPRSQGDSLPALAHHFGRAVLGGDTKKAIHYSFAAGERAMALFAFEEAASHFGSALDALEAEDPLDLARACQASMAGARADWLCGRAEPALTLASRAVDYARGSRSGRLFREAVVVYCELQPGYARDPRALALVDEALARADDRDFATRSRLVSLRSLMAFLDADPRGHARLSRDALELARRSEDAGALLEALRVRSLALNHPSTEDEWRTRYEERIALADSSGDSIHSFEARMHRIEHRLQLADMAGVEAGLREMEEIALRVRSPSMDVVLLRVRAGLAIASGQLDSARTLGERALAIGRRIDESESWAIAQLQLGTVAELSGRVLSFAGDVQRGTRSHPQISLFRAAHISLLLAGGDEPEARRQYLELARAGFRDLREDISYPVALASLAQTCGRLRTREGAALLRERLLPYAGRNITLQCIQSTGCASRSLGIVADCLGLAREADAHFERALAIDRASGARAWEAHAALDWARSLLARGDGVAARQRATETLALATELGLSAPVRAARELLGEAR